jgi:hypothetical protein
MITRYGYGYLKPERLVTIEFVEPPRRSRLLATARTAADFIEHMMFTAVALLGGSFFLFLGGMAPLATVWGILVGMLSYAFWADRRHP